ncbi:MAG TPA: hypothetical protein VEC35_01125 [Noviherbaspirillum sp.]|nr:hypothetical protein [Noviherbaspirillum sp.]
MNTQILPSLDRAARVLREFLMRSPGASRAAIIQHVAQAAGCHSSTAEKALCEASHEGYVKPEGKPCHYKYYWNDNPKQVDPLPQIVKRIPAAEAPRITAPRFANSIAWSMHFVVPA